MIRHFGWLVLGSLAITVATAGMPGRVSAAEPPQYNRDVRPILAENCFACHGPDSASRKADLRLDKRESAIDASVIVEGSPDDSELIARIDSHDPELVMPPLETKKSLTAAQKQTLRNWIAAGAQYQPHWSFIPPAKPALPAVDNEAWVKSPIDRFVLAKLQESHLQPAPEADARTLFRRLHLDITGLPPNPEDVTKFVADYSQSGDAALSDWIDQLMQTPAWGEHRARYWLDAARYGDTHGLHFDNYREMWPYRDWVIRSFNRNQPYDQFTIEQLAGDLLPNPTDDQKVATGFQRCNITTNEGGTIDEENMALYATDRVQTFGWVYLGLTTNCCQCHDHKFDSLTMRDYYSLAAFFRNTTQPPKDGNSKDGRGPVLMLPGDEDRPRWEALPQLITDATRAREARKQSSRGAFDQWLATATPDSLNSDIASDGLIVHLPLDNSKAEEIANACEPAGKVHPTGEVKWIKDGKFGPAPQMKAGATFDLGELGDFERQQPFSYGAWIRIGNQNASGAILARMDEKAGHRGWDLWQEGRKVAVHIIDAWPGNALKVVTRNDVLKPREWIHVFATYDGSGTIGGLKIYVNGAQQQLNTTTNTLKPDASIRTSTPLRIGQRSDSQVFDNGALQQVRIYSRLVTAGEVKALVDVEPLKEVLALAADKRTKEQSAALLDYFLNTRDSEYPKLARTVQELESEREAIKARSPITHVQQEKMDTPAMAYVLTRGEYDRPGDQVSAAPPASLHPLPAGAPQNRLGLARWLMDPANPLTARVTVNRFWQQIFGQGIVSTTEDFGVMGALPTDQALLDWLAVDLRESGWDVKRFFKQMLMSATYRQSARVTPQKLEADRDNSLNSRGPRFRLDAEMMRDYALSASGLLSHKMYGPGVKPYQPDNIWNVVGLPNGDTRIYVQDKGENLYRRTLYNFWKRMAPPPNLEALNAPSREICTVRRERTNTPLQALVTLNDPQFFEAARQLAQVAIKSSANAAAGTLDTIAQRVLSRSLSSTEQSIVLADLQQFQEYYQSHPDDAAALIAVGDSPADATIPPAQLAAWTMVCNELLNLDEAITK
ncbi:MAG: DUF1553 domain-containing protein [Planctomycetaceae bacterium]